MGMAQMKIDCAGCGITHESAKERDEVHQASANVRAWLRDLVDFEPPATVTPKKPVVRKREWGTPAGLPKA
jgi:hypothetical protein